MPSDDELLQAADRDPEAFAAFYRRHAAGVLAFCLRRTRDPETAADLVAETFALALEGCHRFRSDRGPAAGWLYGIARIQCARLHERGAVEARARRRLGVERPALGEADLARLDALARRPEIDAALDELPDDQRDAVRARVVQELEYAEIAAGSGSSEAAVRQRVSRGLAGLRRRLSASPEEHE
ncbi:RNA polymerase sigma factor [Conexibacter sp. SYSU D00693]|uniref:RNA polymerase sigma factor n=1 Tax=Conexibacter sp. SYSU D00693 TaxID=2812560 RepID=UPI00196B6191|nr:sigma-70 family RNA polymerase sigma factor [Conexibacter sp. SYSU D00693]